MVYKISISIYDRNTQSLSEMFFHNVTVEYSANSKEGVEKMTQFIETITSGPDDHFTSFDFENIRSFVLHTKSPGVIMQKLDKYYEIADEVLDKDVKMNTNEEMMTMLLPGWEFDPKQSLSSISNNTIQALYAVMTPLKIVNKGGVYAYNLCGKKAYVGMGKPKRVP